MVVDDIDLKDRHEVSGKFWLSVSLNDLRCPASFGAFKSKIKVKGRKVILY
jgi:hypothetical protein